MKLLILEHYHGDLSGKRHLQPGEQYEVPGEVLTQEAAEELVERGKGFLAVTVTEPPKVANEVAQQGQTGEAQTGAAEVSEALTQTMRRKKNK